MQTSSDLVYFALHYHGKVLEYKSKIMKSSKMRMSAAFLVFVVEICSLVPSTYEGKKRS